MSNLQEHKPHPLARFLLLDLLTNRQSRSIFIYAGIIVVLGAVIYHWLEGWDMLDSFYFVIITLTTIGYGDLAPTTPLTKAITIFYSLNGVAILLMLLDKIRDIREQRLDDRVSQSEPKP